MAALSGFSPIHTTASPHNISALTALGANHVLDRALVADTLLREVRACPGVLVVRLLSWFLSHGSF